MLKWLRRGFIMAAAAVTAYVAYTRLKPRPIPVEALRTDGQVRHGRGPANPLPRGRFGPAA